MDVQPGAGRVAEAQPRKGRHSTAVHLHKAVFGILVEVLRIFETERQGVYRSRLFFAHISGRRKSVIFQCSY